MKQVIFLLLAILLFSCNHESARIKTLQNRIDSLENKLHSCRSNEFLVQSVLWFQHSPEMQALYFQGYNVAKKALEYNLKHKLFKEKKNAVVVDLDETILNNHLYEGWLCFSENEYSDQSWNAWVQEARAELLPGAADFLNFAKNLGCEIFYVSNRKRDPLFEPTLQNLKKLNLPFADEAHLLLKTKDDTTLTGKSTKANRRLKIENELNCEILLLCGDQIADFDKCFDLETDSSEKQVKDRILKYQESFGRRFIVLPNPIYCDWLDQIIRGNKNPPSSHPNSFRRNNIEKWEHE